MNLILKSLYIICFFFLLSTFCRKQTAGFTVLKVQNNCALHPVLEEEPDLPYHLIDQTYSYLGKGKQCYAFVSDDGKYTLKLLNNRYQRKIKIYDLLQKVPFIKRWAHNKLDYYTYKSEKTFASYAIAYQTLQQETALLYIHLHPTQSIKKNIRIKDKIGIYHSISADRTAFFIQKKAELVYPCLLDLQSKGQDDLAKTYLSSLMDLLQTKYKKGIFDNDPLIRTNFGFLDGKAIQIDIGPFSLDPHLCDPIFYVPEIERTTKSLEKWLSKYYPILLPYWKEEIRKITTSYNGETHVN